MVLEELIRKCYPRKRNNEVFVHHNAIKAHNRESTCTAEVSAVQESL